MLCQVDQTFFKQTLAHRGMTGQGLNVIQHIYGNLLYLQAVTLSLSLYKIFLILVIVISRLYYEIAVISGAEFNP